MLAAAAAAGVLAGCSAKNMAYSDEEKQIIGKANQMIAGEYDVTIDEDDFSYSVGKQISENEFVPLDSEQK